MKIKEIFPEIEAKLSHGPFGLIDIKTKNGLIRVNSNGLFDKTGKKITTGQAKKTLKLEDN